MWGYMINIDADLFGKIMVRCVFRRAHLGHGCKVSCGHDGIMTFGKGFVCTAELEFVCMDNIIFGEDVLI